MRGLTRDELTIIESPPSVDISHLRTVAEQMVRMGRAYFQHADGWDIVHLTAAGKEAYRIHRLISLDFPGLLA